MKKISLRLLVFLSLTLFSLSVSGEQKKTITIKGSDTMVILVQKWTESFPDKSVQFQVTGGGSGTGIAALINGTTDICSASRPLKPAEIQQLKEKYNSNGVEIKVAIDGLSVYANKKNPLTKISIEQLRKVFTGKITNWKELGGEDHKIVLYSRENNSGTYEYFKDHVLEKQDFDPAVQHMVGTAALVNAISKDKWGIGYGGAAYASGVKDLAVSLDENGKAELPTEANILSNKYPISRYLYFYLREAPKDETKKFVDWVIGKDGQKVVKEVGYFPLKKK
ncbi:phosphate ABC transporter substrate-binding protein [Leptospira wolffii]|uniref:phosphate ABC transporter substrate-binding protein n=1 Tax=Leptospira wolffii TaxID=409998 RepID=UPI001082634B|nr:phosphate ABC transporter substrate-binding protein [Leptospira wolffii]TGK56233.1 phosphate ABC transporter substrate-binding protein [Leptospira wolffii]TGK72280.1 phosphate ABC transporter substrate-binding protein [Leptospira wolffii]TGK72814.1 phosphate ABC transporter substrate-binding protein [Leptospira wolffii]TGL27857.1 phosphate ABC transporter substrate-binding protein [Leptospira wolffii]